MSSHEARVTRVVSFGNPRGRTLHLIDVENVLGGKVTSSATREMWTAYEQSAPVSVGDHVIAGFCPTTAREGAFALPAWVRKVIGVSGPDSADRALIEAVDVDLVARRFTRVIIASGDARFAPLAWALRNRGVRVLIAPMGPSAISWMLYRTCDGSLTVPARQRSVQPPRNWAA